MNLSIFVHSSNVRAGATAPRSAGTRIFDGGLDQFDQGPTSVLGVDKIDPRTPGTGSGAS